LASRCMSFSFESPSNTCLSMPNPFGSDSLSKQGFDSRS
jgi:hypothetical protein